MEEPRFLADAMVGRLARFLRMLGYDTADAGDRPDHEIRARAGAEGRRLLTRDRALARATPGALLLNRIDLAGQLAQCARAFPPFRTEPRFDRCTRCNGALSAEPELLDDPGAAAAGRAATGPVHRCDRCGQRYWEGSHTARIRADLARMLEDAGR
ncbi:MAG: Mut7-C RNAse domain-containing protein [Thermoplasmata archaeon]